MVKIPASIEIFYQFDGKSVAYIADRFIPCKVNPG